MAATQHDIMFPSGELAIEATLHLPDGEGRFPGVVTMPPAPRSTAAICTMLSLRHWRARFRKSALPHCASNFRGVQMSEGAYDGGYGEIEDAVEAMNYMAVSDGIDASRLGIAGYSFGAAVAIAAAARSNIAQALVSIACPSRVFNEMSAQELLLPKLLMLGEHDHDFPAQQFRFMARRFHRPERCRDYTRRGPLFRRACRRGRAVDDRFLRELACRGAGAAAMMRQTAIAFKSKRVTLEGVLAMPQELPQPVPGNRDVPSAPVAWRQYGQSRRFQRLPRGE